MGILEKFNVSRFFKQENKEQLNKKIKIATLSAKKALLLGSSTLIDLALIPCALGATLIGYCYRSNFDPEHGSACKRRTPILLIHGNGFNETQWVIGKLLLSKKNRNYGSTFTLNLDGMLSNSHEKGIDDYALKVAHKAKEISELTGREDLILIGHSMGGLVASYFAEVTVVEQKLNVRIDKVITIGTPWSGSPFLSNLTSLTQERFPSYLATPKRFRQMRNEDGFLDQLKQRAELSIKERGRRYYSAYSVTDLLVSGDNGCFSSHPEGVAKFSWGGHYLQTVNPLWWKIVDSWLEEGLTTKACE